VNTQRPDEKVPAGGSVQELPRSRAGHQDPVAGTKGEAPNHVSEEVSIGSGLPVVGHVPIDILRLDDRGPDLAKLHTASGD
jgi:hypothetical protein